MSWNAHGDLPPEHICLEPVATDCLGLTRSCGVSPAVGFLALEYRRLGAPWVGELPCCLGSAVRASSAAQPCRRANTSPGAPRFARRGDVAHDPNHLPLSASTTGGC
jgi:hypothetical protein